MIKQTKTQTTQIFKNKQITKHTHIQKTYIKNKQQTHTQHKG